MKTNPAFMHSTSVNPNKNLSYYSRKFCHWIGSINYRKLTKDFVRNTFVKRRTPLRLCQKLFDLLNLIVVLVLLRCLFYGSEVRF